MPIGDAALRLGLTLEDLAEVAGTMHWLARHAPGAPSDELLGSRSESPASRIAVSSCIESACLARSPQYEVSERKVSWLVVRISAGRSFAHLGEFDGKEKYGRLLKPGQTAADAVFAEKRREDALRDLGWQIVRWIWQDLYHPEELRRRLERAFERGLRAA